MRIAVTTSLLAVPPTYFVVDHARLLKSEHDFAFFALAAKIEDAELSPAVTDSLGLTSLPWAARRNLAPLAAPRMRAAIRAFRPDLIHQHFGTWSGPAIGASSDLDVPLLTTLHGYDVWSTLRTPSSALDRWHRRNVLSSARTSKRVLAVSRFLADSAIAGGFDPSTLDVHYQGIDTDLFTPSLNRSVDARPLVVFIGAVSEHKGIPHLIQASRSIRTAHPHELVIIGGGELYESLLAETSEDPQIRLLGRLARGDVLGWLQQASMLVLPTREHKGWREAAGLVLLEAQSTGTPVVAYRSGGTPEMVEDGRTGLLVPEGDVAALGAAMSDVLGLGSAESAAMRSAARDFVVASRSLRVSAQQLDAHYTDVTGAE